ncbi:response regulator, partial [candidate division KSB1 bacterium]
IGIFSILIILNLKEESYNVGVVNSPLGDASMEIRLQATTAHLWFEEILTGYEEETKIFEVYRLLDEALWYADAMLEGGENNEGIYYAVDDQVIREKIKATRDDLAKFRIAAEMRFEKWQSNVSEEEMLRLDSEFDILFSEFSEHADEAEELLHQYMNTGVENMNTQAQTGISVLVIAFVTALTIALVLGIVFSYRFSRPLLVMTGMSKRITEGDFSARNKIIRDDEFGLLGSTFNNMADSIENQIFVQKKSSEVGDLMVVSTSVKEFCEGLIKKLLEVTDTEYGVFYKLNTENSKYEHLASIGVDPELTEPFDAGALEGAFGKAIDLKQITHIKDIPEDTKFKFKTFMGQALPKEIITLPLTVNQKVMALISIANLKNFTDSSLELLEHNWINITSAFSNLLANEKTEILASELQEKNEELTVINEELQAQSDELKEQAVELKNQAEELKIQRLQVDEASRLKSEFLSNMSHELRTPLNSILALSQLMISRKQDRKNEKDNEYLEIIERNGKNLLNLINDILDLSKIESGRMDINISEIKIGEFTEVVLETIKPMLAEKDVQLNVDVDSSLSISSDFEKVHQIMLNLLSNAVKFTNEGEIEIKIQKEAENMMFAVNDTGIGISEENKRFIFEEFRQVDGSTTRAFGGTGLGLAISRKFARKLGGDLKVTSKIGEGSTFTLILPMEYDSNEKIEQELPADTVRVRKSAETGSEKTILIIDDEPETCSLISDFLEQSGYSTVIANSGNEGIELAKEIKPFAITLDILMPEMDGWETLRHLKSLSGTADIPVIVISVSEDRTTGAALGAAGYILKPVEKNTLLNEIQKISMIKSVQNIMVVDDDTPTRLYIQTILEEMDYAVTTASDGQEALEVMNLKKPDAIILDLLMPVMDGFTVIEKLRQDREKNQIPVIILTAKDISIKDKAKLEGAVRRIVTKGTMKKEDLLHDIKSTLDEIESQLCSVNDEIDPYILVVEDDDIAALQIRTALEENHYQVSVASGGDEAIKKVRERIPDAVILDLMMPEIDGFQVLDNIRSTEDTAEIPVLILTAKEITRKELDRLRRNNIKQLIQKGSLDREQLVERVKRLVGKTEDTIIENENVRPEDIEQKYVSEDLILVVEDNPDNMFTISAILEENGLNFIKAADGKEALKMVAENSPGLVLMDIQLPEMSGVEAAAKIRADENSRGLPVIAMTAKAMKGDKEKILASGFDDYISKPIDPGILLSVINKWFLRINDTKNK